MLGCLYFARYIFLFYRMGYEGYLRVFEQKTAWRNYIEAQAKRGITLDPDTPDPKWSRAARLGGLLMLAAFWGVLLLMVYLLSSLI